MLYLQSSDHRFTDSTRQANLREPSFYMLGFGTQFIDGELDGWPDLIIVNTSTRKIGLWALNGAAVVNATYFRSSAAGPEQVLPAGYEIVAP